MYGNVQTFTNTKKAEWNGRWQWRGIEGQTGGESDVVCGWKQKRIKSDLRTNGKMKKVGFGGEGRTIREMAYENIDRGKICSAL